MGSTGQAEGVQQHVQDGSPLKADVDAQGQIDVYDAEGSLACEAMTPEEARAASSVLLWAATASEETLL